MHHSFDKVTSKLIFCNSFFSTHLALWFAGFGSEPTILTGTQMDRSALVTIKITHVLIYGTESAAPALTYQAWGACLFRCRNT
ncbi:hypothetical protein CQ062_20225 [Ochrobactrum sp. MYb68]|nr:hypothetical protein CQ062_20225 [Ochrobactrum sp. MYb68]